MLRIKNWLKNNPRPHEEKIELELLKMAIDLYHVLSLIWDKTTRKYTDSFLIYKVQELLESFVNSVPEDVPYELIDERINNAKSTVSQDCNGTEDALMFYGAEIDNYPGSQYGLTLDFKIGILLYILEQKGISENQIFEKYQN